MVLSRTQPSALYNLYRYLKSEISNTMNGFRKRIECDSYLSNVRKVKFNMFPKPFHRFQVTPQAFGKDRRLYSYESCHRSSKLAEDFMLRIKIRTPMPL